MVSQAGSTSVGRTTRLAVSIAVRYAAAFAAFEWVALFVRFPPHITSEHTETLLLIVAVHAALAAVAGLILGPVLHCLGRRPRLSLLARPDGVRALVASGLTAVYWILAVNVLTEGGAGARLALLLNLVALALAAALALVLLRRSVRRVTRATRIGWSFLVVLVLWLPLYLYANVPSNPSVPYARPPAVEVDPAALEAPRPNLLLIIVDTVRSDCLSCYGSVESNTPHMDNLAERGVIFEQCVAPEPLTRPSVCSILTGLYPKTHGVDSNTKSLDDELTTLAEALRGRGYATGAFVSSVVLSADFGTAQGFETYKEPPEPWTYAGSVVALRRFHRLVAGDAGTRYLKEYRAGEMTRRSTEWMEERGDEPFFALVHYYDAHMPYAPPEGYRLELAEGLGHVRAPYSDPHGRFDPDVHMPPDFLRQQWLRYLGEIAYLDHCIGELMSAFDTLPGSDEAIVVLVADHGESFEHDYYFAHGNRLYDSTVRVPLIFRDPALPAGVRVPSQVRIIDLFPTLLGRLDATGAANAQGVDLAPVVAAAVVGEQAPHLPAYSITDFTANRPVVPKLCLSLRSPPWKYITSPTIGRVELYDLESDPGETLNLADDRPEVALSLARSLESWNTTTAARQVAPEQLSHEQREALKALGYIQ